MRIALVICEHVAGDPLSYCHSGSSRDNPFTG
jgi:hypothetical protein